MATPTNRGPRSRRRRARPLSTLGEILHRMRLETELTEEQLCRRAKIARSTWANALLAAHPVFRVDRLESIANALCLVPGGYDWRELFDAFAQMPNSYADPSARSERQVATDALTAASVRSYASERVAALSPNLGTHAAVMGEFETLASWFETGRHRASIPQRSAADGTDHPYDWRLDHSYPELYPDEAELWTDERGAKLDELADESPIAAEGDGLDFEFGGAP